MTTVPEPIAFDGDRVRLVGDRWRADAPKGIVVLLHGGGQTRHAWQRTGERLVADGYTAIALDARGHGESAWHPDGDYTIDGFAADLLAFATSLEQPPVLVGASLGGMTALIAAGEHPGLARGLVLVDVVVAVEPAGVARIRDFLTGHLDGFATLDEVADAVAAYSSNRRRPRNLDGLRKNVRQREDGRWYWHWDPAFMRIDDEPQRLIRPDRLRAAARRLDIPVLVVRGRESDIVSDAGVADMRELIPQAEVVDVAAAGHMVAGDDNDVFVTRLADFLARLVGPAH